jgi:cyanate permease
MAFICLMGTIGFMFVPSNVQRVVSAAMFGLGVALVIVFFMRVAFQIRHARPELYFKPQI